MRLIKRIARFSQEVGNWLIHVEPRGRYDRFRIPTGWSGDGIIARINSKPLAQEIMASGLPTVNVSWFPFSSERVARCMVDQIATGKMAAEYFLSAGFEKFGYCGPHRKTGYPDLFAESFCSAIKAAKFSCDIYSIPADDLETIPWKVHLASLVEWLERLPRPRGSDIRIYSRAFFAPASASRPRCSGVSISTKPKCKLPKEMRENRGIAHHTGAQISCKIDSLRCATGSALFTRS